jgi:hypothetical protein
MAYAWDYDAIPIFPDLNRGDSHLPYNKEAIFFRLDAPLQSPRPFIHSFSESVWHSSEKVPFQPDQILRGYFQSWRHFHHHREKILDLFAPREKTLQEIEETYAKLLSHPNTVSLHVRTFNKRHHLAKEHPFIGLDYYQKAMSHFPEDTLFVIFSDRINWCKKHFPRLGRPCVFIEEKDSVKELHLMSMMKHQIICNSTFSWWAAYMNRNPEQIVIAPKSWMHPDYYDFPPPQPNDFYLPHWTTVQQNYDETYPLDMTWYDTTTSLDGN